jgi:hypothetical protein
LEIYKFNRKAFIMDEPKKKSFHKSKIIKTKSESLRKSGRISKLLKEEQALLEGRLAEIKQTLLALEENPGLEKLIEIVVKPLEVEK